VSVFPVVTGLYATVLAAMQVAAWLAMGSFAVPRMTRPIIALPVALLVGSATTAFLYAVFTLQGHVKMAIAVVAVVSIGALIVRIGWVITSVARVWNLIHFQTKPKWLAAGCGLVAVMYWIDAIVPPRDADVMRYHLAHIRQIILEGRWVALADYHYALPFGWSLNYLPFELLHIPEGAHLLNLGAWLIALLVIAALLRERGAPRASFLLLAFIALQPLVLKSATTAHADLYAVFVVLGIVLLLEDVSNATGAQMGLLGFVATVGAQSRYQLLGVTVCVFLVGVLLLIKRRIDIRMFSAAALGAVLGLLIASPFYVVNFLAFRNPFWPLLIPRFNGLELYASRVAENVNESLTGHLTMTELVRSARLLVTDQLAFPTPLLALASLASPLWSRDTTVRTLALFNAAFLCLWALVQPSLYPRFSILLVPPLLVGLGLSLRSISRIRVLNCLLCCGLIVGMIGFFVFDLYYSEDSARYVATGDSKTFHEATWFYPVYQWVNDSTPPQSRVLVIVRSGHSYYLDRAYRKADPFLSGYVDWEAVRRASDLTSVLDCARFDYVIYDATDWDGLIGGRNLDSALRNAISQRDLTMAKSFNVRLVTSRVRGEGVAATVWVLRRTANSPPDCARVRATQPFLD
jgi:hypothetical protein